jgi:cytochrome c peroxidase
MVWAALCCTSLAALAQPAHQVGTQDVRTGYDSPEFRTRSQAVEMREGERLPLARLAQRPPLGLPPLSQRFTAAEVDLGRQLFFDRRLSVNATLSCAMCHIPEQGFTQNEIATPVGNEGRGVRRNAPALYNVGYVQNLFLDGRERSLVEQIWSPLLAGNEMANHSRRDVLLRLRGIDDYARRFQQVFGEGVTEVNLGEALAAYQSALLSGASPFDHWYFGGADVLPEPARRGFEIFQSRGCNSCHTLDAEYALFTDGNFHNTGTGFLRDRRAAQPRRVQLAPGVFVTPTIEVETETFTDHGRLEVTGEAVDKWRYRTPTLRNVALTAPYMHDGSLATLRDVVAFYDAGGGGDPQQDPRIRPLGLSVEEQDALVAFLSSLTGDNVHALAADARSVQIGDVEHARQSVNELR